MGDLLSRLQMNSSPSDGRGKNSSDNGNSAVARASKQGRRMAVDQGRVGVDHQGQATIQSGKIKSEKTTLAMGYRADCEKCRARVPGHFNHFVKRV